MSFMLILLNFMLLAINVIGVVLLYVMASEAMPFIKAKLSKKPLIFEFDPATHSFAAKVGNNLTVYEDKENMHYLGGVPAYSYGHAKVFLALKGMYPALDPKLLSEIQKSLAAGVITHEQLAEIVRKQLLQEQVVERVVETPEGPKTITETITLLRPLVSKSHRVVAYTFRRPNEKEKKHRVNVAFDVEMYEPIQVEAIQDYYGRNLSSDAIRKILTFRDLQWAERARKIYEEIKQLRKDKGGGIGFNPVWIIYIGIFLFIVIMALSMYGGGSGGGGANVIRPPTP